MAEALDISSLGPSPAWPATGVRGNGTRGGMASVLRLADVDCSQELFARFCPSVVARQFAEWEHGRGELAALGAGTPCEMEFLLPAHLAVMLPDGCSAGWEWSNGKELRVLPSLPAGAILFNPVHNYLRIRKKAQGRCRILLVSINPDSIRRLSDMDVDVSQVQFRQEINLHDQAIGRTLIAFQDEIEHPGHNSRGCCNALTLLLLTQLIRSASNFAQPRRPAYVRGGLPKWRLNRALGMLERRWNESPTLAELAGDVGLHPSSFCRAFKLSTGVSPHRYLIELRIARAKELMADRAPALTQIALDCGFNSSSQFSVAFRRITGVAPRAYRNSL